MTWRAMSGRAYLARGVDDAALRRVGQRRVRLLDVVERVRRIRVLALVGVHRQVGAAMTSVPARGKITEYHRMSRGKVTANHRIARGKITQYYEVRLLKIQIEYHTQAFRQTQQGGLIPRVSYHEHRYTMWWMTWQAPVHCVLSTNHTSVNVN